MSPQQQIIQVWVNGELNRCAMTAEMGVHRVRYVQSGAEARVEVEFNADGYRTMTRKIDVTGMDERQIFKALAEIV